MIKIAHAQTAAAEASRFIGYLNDAIIFPLVVLLSAVALIVFLYGAFEYVLGADNEQKRVQGQKHLLWGLVGFVVIVSAMAILQIAAGTVPGTIDPKNPSLPDPYDTPPPVTLPPDDTELPPPLDEGGEGPF